MKFITHSLIFLGLALVSVNSYAQMPMGGGGMAAMMKQMPGGRLYGKVIDENTKQPVPFTPIQLFVSKYDKATKAYKDSLAGGQLSEENGDFSIENIPVFGKYTLKIAALGYKSLEMPVAFDMNMKPGNGGGQPNMAKMASAFDKDLGNIKLVTASKEIKEVVIDGSAPAFKLDIDKKVYNVEKNPVAAGGTAQDVMKNIPSVNVDLDGNVTMRNGSPQIFVDGRPTTLTIDQIPADAIEKIELITNPSAKYDAGDGGGGIINIVMKKNRQIGYNGNIRVGTDKRLKALTGFDLNVRQGKWNFFVSGNLAQRKSIGYGETDRLNLTEKSLTTNYQTTNSVTNGYFGFGKLGFDYFINNRNTLTFAPSVTQGHFEPGDELTTINDSIHGAEKSRVNSYFRNSQPSRTFTSIGTQLLFKHVFPKAGHELTADVNYQSNTFKGNSSFTTQYYDAQGNASGSPLVQTQIGTGTTKFTTLQTDYVNPITETSKIELGARAAIRDFDNSLDNYINGKLTSLPNSNYQYLDQVFAGYATYTGKADKWGYQLGLRAESSNYQGKIKDNSGQTYKIQYPIIPFPSGFVSYAINDNNNFQLSYTRRISRPGFFQLIPFTDYSDSLNLRKGNPNLKPQFTNSVDLNFQHIFNKDNNILASMYLKHTNGIITSYQEQQQDSALNKKVIINTYQNANYSYAYGFELTSKNAITSKVDLTSNINFYNSYIDASNIQSNLTNSRFSWFGKVNMNIKLPKNVSVQISADYNSKSVLPISGGGGGMGGFGGGPTSTAQGYMKERYGVDLGLKYDFLKNKMASLIFNVSDVFKTRRFDSYSESAYFVQNNLRYRDQQFWRIIFSYRFGKYDVSLFKRKNNKMPEMDDSSGM